MTATARSMDDHVHVSMPAGSQVLLAVCRPWWRLLPILALLLASTHCAVAQTGDTLTTENLFELADASKTADPQEFKRLVGELESRRAEMDPHSQLFLDYLAGYLFAFEGNLDQAIAKYNSVYNSVAAPQLRYRVAYSIANLLAVQGRIEEGFPYLESVLHWETRIADIDIRQRGLQVAVIFYNLAGLYDLALATAERLLDQPMEGRNACVARMAWTESLLYLDQLGANRGAAQRGLDYCVEIGEVLAASFIRIYIARLDIAEANPERALSELVQGLEVVESTGYARVISEYYSVIARALYDTGDPDGAFDYANKALDSMGPDGYTVPHVSVWETLWKIATDRGDPVKALEYHIRYSAADRARLDDIKAKSLAYHTSRHQSLQRISQIEILNKQNEVLKLEQELSQEEARNTGRISILLAALLLVAAGWIWKAWHDRKKLKNLM